jgi:hypothetical protein
MISAPPLRAYARRALAVHELSVVAKPLQVLLPGGNLNKTLTIFKHTNTARQFKLASSKLAHLQAIASTTAQNTS